jgi:hypothetical protein
MMAADTNSRQALDTESDLFSPRSTAALALSSFAAQAVVEQQQQPPLHHRPASLFGNDADDDDSVNDKNMPSVRPPAQSEQCNKGRAAVVLPTKKPTAPTIASRKWEKKSETTQKSSTTRHKNPAKAEMKKCFYSDRARDRISFPSSLPHQYPDQHQYQPHSYYMPHQQPQYAMIPVQFLPGYAVHYPDFYPPGATAVPWTPHSCHDSLTGTMNVHPPHGPSSVSSSIVSSRGPSPSPPPPLVFQRDGRPSPTTIVSIKPEPPLNAIETVRMPGPPPGILHRRPSPPLRASPPMFAMMPRSHNDHRQFHRPPSITWHYPSVSSDEAVCI